MIEIATQTLLTQKDHFIHQTQEFITRTAESYETQLAERLDMLDIFLDSLDAMEDQPAQEINSHLQKIIRLKVKIESDQIEALVQRAGKHKNICAMKYPPS